MAGGGHCPPKNFSGLFLKVLYKPLTAPLQWPPQMKMSDSAPGVDLRFTFRVYVYCLSFGLRFAFIN